MRQQVVEKMGKSMKWLILLCVFLSLLFIIILLSISHNPPPPNKTAVAALYSDVGTWEESVQAAEKMFQWMNYTVELVNADHINNNGLDDFSILCIPGGNMYQYVQDISSRGMENIKNFIGNGGSYIGICAGAYFASEKVVWRGNQLPMRPLGVFPSTAEGPINEIAPYPNYTMCKVNIVDSAHPITQSEPDSAWMLYYWGPVLIPNKDANITILGRYDRGNQPTMLAFDYGLGRAFLIGTHSEIEEDSERDGVAFADESDDHGSDWELMRKAVLWSLKKCMHAWFKCGHTTACRRVKAFMAKST